jgi:phosphatidylethanolamine/phosphatidyl-N-methylethanolamine N-methyltransferase
MRDTANGPGLREHMFLFSRFLKSPRTVGALTASSRALAQAMVADLNLSEPVRVVELGPGTGAFTSAIVERLGPDTRFLAVDIDPAFCQAIHKRWPKVECVNASAEDLEALVIAREMLPVDHIVSGLPFVSLPQAMTKLVLAAVSNTLRIGGTFTTFQYVHGYQLPSAVAFRASMSARMGESPHVRLVLRNLPPALVLTWKKK